MKTLIFLALIFLSSCKGDLEKANTWLSQPITDLSISEFILIVAVIVLILRSECKCKD
jgi:hypothetical protein